MRNKKQWKVTMVNLEQIATKKYRFCSTTKSVQNFCTKYGVNRFWWTPPEGSKKLLMVDFQDFRQCWSHVYGKPAQTSRRPAEVHDDEELDGLEDAEAQEQDEDARPRPPAPTSTARSRRSGPSTVARPDSRSGESTHRRPRTS